MKEDKNEWRTVRREAEIREASDNGEAERADYLAEMNAQIDRLKAMAKAPDAVGTVSVSVTLRRTQDEDKDKLSCCLFMRGQFSDSECAEALRGVREALLQLEKAYIQASLKHLYREAGE